LNQGFNALAVLLGMPQPMDPLLRGSSGIPVPPKTVAVGIPADLVRRRPDIRAAELAAMAQSAQIGFAEANLYPAFSLTGTFGTSASDVGRGKLKRVFEGSGITFAFGPSFRWNILNYGQITNQVRVEDAGLQGLLVDYQNTVLKAQQEVENGLTSFLQGREQVDFLRQSAAAANAALGIAFLQYNLGTRDFTTVLTAEQNLYTAQNDLAMAEGQRVDRVGLRLPRAGRRMANPGGQRVRACRDGRRDEEPHKLGRAAAASRHAAAACASVADASRCQSQPSAARMVRSP
jgi:outer membrane protein TolC